MSTEKELEKKINDKELNAPRLTPDCIDAAIQSKSFTLLPSSKSMICELVLVNGFSVEGVSSCVSAENFDQEIGQEISFKNAREKIWELEGYLLQQKLYEAKNTA